MKKQKSLTLNASLSLINTFISMVFPLVTFPYVSRVLQVDNIGSINFANSIVEYFSLIAAFGISSFAIRTGAGIRDDKTKINVFASRIFSINICTTLFAFLLLLLSLLIPTEMKYYKSIMVIQSITLLSTPFALDWLYSIYEDFSYITLRNLIVKLFSVLLIFVFVKNSNDTLIYALIMSLATVVSNLLNFIYSKKYVTLKIVKDNNWQFYKYSLFVFFVNSIATTIYLNSDKTMLGLMCGVTSVGLYTTATNIYSIVKRISGAAILVLIPRLAYYVENDFKKFNQLLTKIVHIAIVLTIPACAELLILSKDIVLVIAGKGYENAQMPLIVLSLALIFATIANIYSNGVLLNLKKEKYIMRCTLVSAIVNFLLNFIFIPFFKETGAAITTLIAEMIMCMMAIYYSKEGDNCIDRIVCKRTINNSILGTILIAASGYFLNIILADYNIFIRVLIIVFVCSSLYLMIEYLLKEETIIDGCQKCRGWIHERYKNK